MNCEYVQLICNGLYTNGKEILGQYVRGKQSLFHSLNLVKGIILPSPLLAENMVEKEAYKKSNHQKHTNHKIKGLFINDVVYNPSLNVSSFGQMKLVETRPSVNYAKDWLDHSFLFFPGLVWSEKEFHFGCDH